MQTFKKIIRIVFTVIAIVGVMVAVGQADNTENEVLIRGIGVAVFAIGSIGWSLTSTDKKVEL